MKVADAPAHIGLAPVVKAIEAEGTTTGFTVIVIPVLVAVVGLAQVAFEVNTHETICPLVNDEVVYVAPVATLVPSTFH